MPPPPRRSPVRIRMNSRITRALFALAAVSALLAGIFTLGSADAQTPAGNNVRPKASFERVDSDGQVLEGFFYGPEPHLNIVRLSMIPNDRRDGTTVTYQDFGYFQIFYEKTSGSARQLHADASQRWFTASNTALTACSGDGSRCSINKTEWQALAGQTGAADTDVVRPITIAFKVPASIANDNSQIRVLTKHVPSAATRTAGNPGNGWASLDWTRVDKHRAVVTPLTADGEPITDYVFSNAAGNLGANLVHVRISIGGGNIPGFSSATYARWGSAATHGAHIRINGMLSGTTANLVNNQVQSVFFKADGTTALGCASGVGGDCRLTKATWQALAGQTGVADTEPIKPIRIAFKVPSQTQGGTAFDVTSTVTLHISRTGAQDDAGNSLSSGSRQSNTEFTRLISQVFRYQSGSRAANGARTPLEPGTSLPSGSTHVGLQCQTGHTGTDCTRALEVGEYLYVAQTILSGGPAINDGRLNRAGSNWLAYGPEHFNQVEVSYVPAAGAGGGDAIVVHDTLCPINVADSPEHPFVDSPRDRTAAALRVCKFDLRSYYGDTYRTVDNPGGSPFWAAGTGPLVIGTKTGTGTVTVKHTQNGVLVGQGSFPLTIAAATQTRLTSDNPDTMITAELGQRTADDSLALLIGYQRDRGIPLHWGWHRATFIGNVGYVGPARYEDIASVALTVPAGGGTLRLLGTANSCTAETSACTLTLDKAALQQAARYRYTPEDGAAAIADTDPIFPPALRLHHAAAADVTITGVLTLADGTTTHNFSYTANAAPADAVNIRAHLRGDADRILEPGQTANIAVGYQLPEDDLWTDATSANDGTFAHPAYAFGGTRPGAPRTITFRAPEILASVELSFFAATPGFEADTIQSLADRSGDWTWKSYSAGSNDFTIKAGDPLWIGADEPPVTARYSAVPATWSIDSYDGNVDVPARSSGLTDPQPADMTGAYLEISGPATWAANGGKRLALENSSYAYFTCVDSSTLDLSLDADARTCFVSDAQGRGPQLRVDAASSGQIRIIANLPAWQLIGASPADDLGGTASSPVIVGFERPRNTHALRRLAVFGTTEIEVRSVGPIASAALARKGGATGAVRTGDPARIELSILDENGNAARAASLSSVTITATGGKLRAGTSEGGSQFCAGGTTCVITVRDTDSDDGNDLVSASAANGSLLAKIFVDLYDVKTAGTATVSATIVVAAASADPVYRADPLTVAFSGAAASLSLSEKLQRVNAYDTVGDDPDTDAVETGDDRVDAGDSRDQIKIPVTAADSRDQTAGIPVRTAVAVTGPGGAAVPAGALSASIGDCNAGRTSCNIVIDVNAAPTSPLASGRYTVKISSGSLASAEVAFGVAGNPGAIAFETGDPGSIGTQFESVITVTDAAGEPVADGTEVSVSVASRGSRIAVPVTRISPAVQRTANGRVTARFVVIGREVATIKARAGSAAALDVVDARTAPAAESADPAAGLGTTAVNTFATWTGTGTGATTSASSLLDARPALDRVFLWNGIRWLLYAEVDGTPIPGSLDYLIQSSDTLWLGAAE